MKEVQLSQGKVALVDDEDFDRVNQFKWCAIQHRKYPHLWYSVRSVRQLNGKQKTVLLHRFILPGFNQLDHVDRNGLNNQKGNLRPANHSQNAANRLKHDGAFTSGFKGVEWSKAKNRWIARIRFQGKNFYLGHYKIESDAAIAYDWAAKVCFGEFARLNFPG